MALTRGEIEPEGENAAVGYERRDVNPGGLVGFAITLTVSLLLIFVCLWVFFQYFERQAAYSDARRHPILSAPRALPPVPRLQPDPIEDLHALRTSENEILNGYGWVDPKNNVVRIPIERAMQIMQQRGLQARIVPGVPAVQPPGGNLITGSRESTHEPKHD
jgi:hypothetical protein